MTNFVGNGSSDRFLAPISLNMEGVAFLIESLSASTLSITDDLAMGLSEYYVEGPFDVIPSFMLLYQQSIH